MYPRTGAVRLILAQGKSLWRGLDKFRTWAETHGIEVENSERTWIFFHGGSRISWCPTTKLLSHWQDDGWYNPQNADRWEEAKAIIHKAWGLESLGAPRIGCIPFTRIPGDEKSVGDSVPLKLDKSRWN